jgi:lysozyme family protein
VVAFRTVVNGYINMWDSCTILPEDKDAVHDVVARLISMKGTLKNAEILTGAPWWWIGCVLYREANLNLDCYLGNGQPIGKVTTVVPIGRGPFASFEAGCVDALKLQKADGVPLLDRNPSVWTIEFALYAAEELNGEGYGVHQENSPYVWAGTNHEQPGLFTSDHGYDPNVRDKRLGVAAIMKGLVAIDNSVVVSRSQKVVHMPPVGPESGAGAPVTGPSTAPPPQPSSGGPFPIPGPLTEPIPTGGVAINKPILSMPGGPNVILDVEHSIESGLNILPTIAVFVPQLQVVTPFIPLIKEVLAASEEVSQKSQSGEGLGVAFGAAVEEHIQTIFAKLQGLGVIRPAQ